MTHAVLVHFKRFKCRTALSFDLQPHAIIARHDAGRQFSAQFLVIEVGMQVGQDGAARLELADPAQRIVEIKWLECGA